MQDEDRAVSRLELSVRGTPEWCQKTTPLVTAQGTSHPAPAASALSIAHGKEGIPLESNSSI